MMRLTYFVYSTYQNTGNKVVFEHANRLKDRGYDVSIITFLGRHPTWFDLKVPVRNIFHIFSLSKNDIAVATFWVTAYWLLLSRANKKFYFILGREEEFYTNPLLRKTAALTLHFPFTKFVISKYLKKYVHSHVGKRVPVQVIKFFALDTTVFKPDRRKNISSSGKIRVLSVLSWYNRYKGPDRLVKAVNELGNKYPGKFSFTLVSLQDKPYKDVFDHFYSKVSTKKLVRLYQETDILLATGRYETFFIPGLEAMACGCLVVATSTDGISEYATNLKNAIVLKNLEDVWKKDTIANLLKDTQLVKRLVNEGYKTAGSYGWDAIIDNLEKIYFKFDTAA